MLPKIVSFFLLIFMSEISFFSLSLSTSNRHSFWSRHLLIPTDDVDIDCLELNTSIRLKVTSVRVAYLTYFHAVLNRRQHYSGSIIVPQFVATAPLCSWGPNNLTRNFRVIAGNVDRIRGLVHQINAVISCSHDSERWTELKRIFVVKCSLQYSMTKPNGRQWHRLYCSLSKRLSRSI